MSQKDARYTSLNWKMSLKMHDYEWRHRLMI